MGKKAGYGKGHPIFLEYTKRIVGHPVFKGMPDPYLDSGDIQWEAPTNRGGGKFKDTNINRRKWWEEKAKEAGIDITENEWISKTAKLIHPFKERPCKNCGRVMDIRYAYPNDRLLNRITKLPYYSEDFPLDPFEHITELAERLYERYENQILSDLPNLLTCKEIEPPSLRSISEWIEWIEKEYIPLEPSMLSPGAMANPPDRFDGFHSLNRCCRAKIDSGRWKKNLQSYTTDRRAFEHWCDGDWIAADRLMGQVNSNEDIQKEQCYFGHPGPCSADHIGPISLGFTHRPEFQLLCKSCNSSKGNRMFLSDVKHLRDIEKNGENVISWYAKDIWDMEKNKVDTNEKALRLSKILRDNRYTAMELLKRVMESGNYVFLASFLGLKYADNNISFENLHVENNKTKYDKLISKPRTTKYAITQKIRRFKIGFETLSLYFEKENRNALLIWNDEIENKLMQLITLLNGNKTSEIGALDEKINNIFEKEVFFDEEIKEVIEKLPSNLEETFINEKKMLKEIMGEVAKCLNDKWEDDRYVRVTESEFTVDEEE